MRRFLPPKRRRFCVRKKRYLYLSTDTLSAEPLVMTPHPSIYRGHVSGSHRLCLYRPTMADQRPASRFAHICFGSISHTRLHHLQWRADTRAPAQSCVHAPSPAHISADRCRTRSVT
ncbi:hypothetical protein NP493_697g01032 [Ridgeia piscesae]|uniref:Uncharacterized protein n=1 Tax=Ridgeia piscesae TaxID=27915 RepID=A0AAD9NMW5_RIDPI|nr:hypothetical protein NP493_697g01032 [Ridgeia piscesae]